MYPSTLHDVGDCDVCLMYAQHAEHHHAADNDAKTSDQPRSIAEAIELGRRLQREEATGLFSRYRSKLNSMQKKLDDAAKYREEAEKLRVEMEEVKDHLMALQMAYEELAVTQLGTGEGAQGWTDIDEDDDRSATSAAGSVTVPEDEDEAKDEWTEDEGFDIVQQLKLMEQWDKEDAEWFEARQKETDEVGHVIGERQVASTSSRQEVPSSLAARTSVAQSISPPPYTVEHPIASSSRSSALPDMFVDACTHGIGLVFDNKWAAWRFNTLHPLVPVGTDRNIIMSWAELIAVEMGVRTLLSAGYSNVAITIRSDNEGVVQAFRLRRWMPKFGLDDILQRVLKMCERSGIELRLKWVWTKANPADAPSRGVYPPRTMMLEQRPDIPHGLIGLVEDITL